MTSHIQKLKYPSVQNQNSWLQSTQVSIYFPKMVQNLREFSALISKITEQLEQIQNVLKLIIFLWDLFIGDQVQQQIN